MMATHSLSPLRGTFTALVTPMNKDGSVDYGALNALIDFQVAEGIDGLVPCGTTGESVTLDADERQQVIAHVVEKIGGKLPVIAGTGGNNTKEAVEHQKRAKDAGADYTLVATPYYNKPTDEGLYRHYNALLEAADIPIVLYNVPGRTACDMRPAAVARIAKLPGIIGIKEATADLDRVQTIRAQTNEKFALLSGDDASAFSFMCLGGDGLISVSSNLVPNLVTKMVRGTLNGEMALGRSINSDLREIFSALFLESNPIPVKAALAMKGLIGEHYRLPLCEMGQENRQRLQQVLHAGKYL